MELKDIVSKMFKEGKIEGFLGYKNGLPYLFTKDEELQDMDTGAENGGRYPLPKTLISIQRKYPDKKLGILVRGCDERHLIELSKNNMVDLSLVEMVGIACSKEQAERCRCSKPYPDHLSLGDKVEGVSGEEDIDAVYGMGVEKERLSYWLSHFERCIKCYGCRNVCPQCFCESCALEEPELVERGKLPPTVPAFHIIRAFHMAGRCVDCGLCEEACPAHIPLRTLYRGVRKAVKELLGYEPGRSLDEMEPFSFLGTGEFSPTERTAHKN